MAGLYLERLQVPEQDGVGDVRYIGQYLIFEYHCEKCGVIFVPYEPDYPYVGPASTWTCHHCAAVIRLVSPEPIFGTLRRPRTCIRNST